MLLHRVWNQLSKIDMAIVFAFLLKTKKGLFRLIRVCASRSQGTSAKDLWGERLELYLTSTRPHLGLLPAALWLCHWSASSSLRRPAVLLGHRRTAPHQQTPVLLHQKSIPELLISPLFLEGYAQGEGKKYTSSISSAASRPIPRLMLLCYWFCHTPITVYSLIYQRNWISAWGWCATVGFGMCTTRRWPLYDTLLS